MFYFVATFRYHISVLLSVLTHGHPSANVHQAQVPKNFACLTIGISNPSIDSLKLTWVPLFTANKRYELLSMLRVSLFAWNKSRIVHSSSSTQKRRYFKLRWAKTNVVSSANCIHTESVRCKCRSFTKIRKISGPRQDPCGVPYFTMYSSLRVSIPVLVVLHFKRLKFGTSHIVSRFSSIV